LVSATAKVETGRPTVRRTDTRTKRTGEQANVRILVGVDFSDGSARAVAEARGLAVRLGGELVGLHVEESFARSGSDDGSMRAELAERVGLRPADLLVRRGFAWMELVRYAREIEPLVVVVGSHGASGFQPLALGSTAARLGVLSPYPVLVVTASERVGRTVAAGAVGAAPHG
jgi:nucleotide-binding universal stress UspA family protein